MKRKTEVKPKLKKKKKNCETETTTFWRIFKLCRRSPIPYTGFTCILNI